MNNQTSQWEPPDHLVADAINGHIDHRLLSCSDRAWLIAQLTHDGHTTTAIAAWLHCSRRTVQMVRREPIAVLTTRLLVADPRHYQRTGGT